MISYRVLRSHRYWNQDLIVEPLSPEAIFRFPSTQSAAHLLQAVSHRIDDVALATDYLVK